MNEPIDLRRYKQAQADRAKRDAARAKAAHRRPPGRGGSPSSGGKEPILGGNPRAKLFLVALVLIFAALWLGPMLLR